VAYAEASNYARRLHPKPWAYYQPKMQKTNAVAAAHMSPSVCCLNPAIDDATEVLPLVHSFPF